MANLGLMGKAKVISHYKAGTILTVYLKDTRLKIGDVLDITLKKTNKALITDLQRNHIYALIGNICRYTGDDKDSAKHDLKYWFMAQTGYEEFSLSDCSKAQANEFIDFLINFILDWGIPTVKPLYAHTDDIDRYLYLCINNKKCAVCGQSGELHHWDTIGMGFDRDKVDDSDKRKICLCRKHHAEAHNTGVKGFQEKYHLYGIFIKNY